MPERTPLTPPTPPPSGPKPRADAARNREAVLAAADRLFAEHDSPGTVTMADIAAAAGVGKATLFRGFGDRTGLIRALHETRLAPIRQAAEDGPPPLGPTTPPHERVPALLDALLCFKLDNRHLALALEGTGNDSPYAAGHYPHWHTTLRTALEQIPDLPTPDFTAHALLAATRADLVEHLTGHENLTREQLRSRLAEFTARVLGPPTETSDHRET
ncbi:MULTISPECIES: TetR/AcrR family transcriptional regulator [Streptomyces]|uniref:TetR/AcrR family transcriptional regulator n=1 Tax=Streptomyces TaxID=1883 RepID=UPI000978EB05|nr:MULTISPECIES: TetR/AcrR family transcriptional regulator [unclassified Streptomyces]ONI54580.1 putative HTH-type transcriptional regulator [Streptomyces sp. IB2014 011-1]RDV53159.1 TetR/AcrR family transcriptional regulator [Streptomyces sp. IB2014 011-12]CAD5964795.1 TetR/AcrR family transcriptional regulator [Streptomyces sp. KY70]CAD5978276.1 Putative HTH-type transcriptional regulator [Streptomyces sp. KY75]